MIAVLVVLFTLSLGFSIALLGASLFDRRRKLITPVSPLGYKRAQLITMLDSQCLRGVTGSHTYALDAEKAPNSPGFYSYSRWEDAQRHPQSGNVYLEVYSSGNVQAHDLGLIADHQRVLQLIIADCDDCGEQATTWFWNERSSPAIRLFCTCCAQHYRVMPLVELQRYVNRLMPGVIVSTATPTALGGAFVPTKINEIAPMQ